MLQLIPGGFIKEVVEDTTPVLGGDLDGGGFNISNVSTGTFADVTGTGTGKFGGLDIGAPSAGDTLIIKRAAGEAHIKSGDGYLVIESDGNPIYLNPWDSSDILLAFGGGSVGVGVVPAQGRKLHTRGHINSFRMDRGSVSTGPFIIFVTMAVDYTSVTKSWGFGTPTQVDFQINDMGVDVTGYGNNRFIIKNTTGNVGVGVTDPHSKLEVNGAVSSATLTITASANDTNVSGINTIFVNTAGVGNDIVIGGLVGGVEGQELRITVIDNTNDTTILNVEGINQDIYLHKGADETLSPPYYGGWKFVCNGTNWYDVSHAQHVP